MAPRLIALLVSFLVVAQAPWNHAWASDRVALVIGNSAYKHAPSLTNPENDAEDVARSFENLGFLVIKHLDLDKRGMERVLQQFAEKLSTAKVGVFFYAGHGLQVSGRNYMVPVDATLSNAYSVDFELIQLGIVLRTMEQATTTNILFVDACRDNPLARNLARAMGTRSSTIGQGLARMEAGVGTLISFSTQPGNVALDGDGRNSPFAGALANHIVSTDGDISDVLINVRRDVINKTGRRQIPWEHSALMAKFYFKAPEATQKSAPATVLASPNLDKEAELAHWNAVRDSQSPDIIGTYLSKYPDGTFAAVARVLIARSQHEGRESVAKMETAALAALDTKANRIEASGPAQMAMEQQRELQRVGCYISTIDGDWGPASKRAMTSFNARTKLNLRTDAPTAEGVTAVKKVFAQVCPQTASTGRTPSQPQRNEPASSRQRPHPKRYSLKIWPPYSLQPNARVSKGTRFGQLICVAGSPGGRKRRCWWR